MAALPILSIIIIIFITVIIVIILLKKLKRQSQLIQDLRLEGERWSIYPNQSVIETAVEKANQIVSQAELSAIKTEAEKSMEFGLLENQLQNNFQAKFSEILSKLTANVDQSNSLISQSLASASKKHDDFLLQLQKQNLDWQNTMETDIKAKTNELLSSFEARMTDFFQSSQKQSLDAINLEIKSARALIDSYKSQQLAIVDENIIAVLEQTLALVIKKKLSLRDQMDMVYEALEKAKLEKFLI